MGLWSHTGQGWSLSCRSVHILGKAPHPSDRRLLFCETGNTAGLTLWQLDEIMRVTNRNSVA